MYIVKKYIKAILFIWCSMMLQPMQAMEKAKQEGLSLYVTNNTNTDLEIFTKPRLHTIKPYRTKFIGQANKLGIVTAQSKGLGGRYSLRLNIKGKKPGTDMQLITVSWHRGIAGGALFQESAYRSILDEVTPTFVNVANLTNKELKLEYIVDNSVHTIVLQPRDVRDFGVKLNQLEDIFLENGPSLFEDLMEMKYASKDKTENDFAYFDITTYDGSIKVGRRWGRINK